VVDSGRDGVWTATGSQIIEWYRGLRIETS
jgi:hypothetical protein